MDIGGMNFQLIFYGNVAAEVRAEDHGRGSMTERDVPQRRRGVYVHFHNGNLPPPLQACDGILGIDLLDDLSVDPVKDASARRAYLAVRV